jgi:hypothetical protein
VEEKAANASQGDIVVENKSTSEKPGKKRDHDAITIDSPVSSSVAKEESRCISDSFPERISVERCEDNAVNGIYQLDRRYIFGKPIYVKKAIGRSSSGILSNRKLGFHLLGYWYVLVILFHFCEL